jgi:hypothetical protein
MRLYINGVIKPGVTLIVIPAEAGIHIPSNSHVEKASCQTEQSPFSHKTISDEKILLIQTTINPTLVWLFL